MREIEFPFVSIATSKALQKETSEGLVCAAAESLSNTLVYKGLFFEFSQSLKQGCLRTNMNRVCALDKYQLTKKMANQSIIEKTKLCR
jgi:hypothetical protein